LGTGHIERTVRIIQKAIDEYAYLLEISVAEQLGVYLMSKGSIAIDGVSLTIFGCDAQSVRLSIIPHTSESTVLGTKQIGDIVNLEIYMMTKYLYTFVHSK